MAFGRKRSSGYTSTHDVQWLVAGLGNPGPKYAGSPHNVGFAIVDQLAEAHRIAMIAKHDGMYGVGRIAAVDVAVLEPLTYMNLSGRSVKPAMRALGLTPEQIIVVHDEIDLPFGQVQIKRGGGLAGHNGLKSISDMIGTRDFTRVRIGVGRPDEGDRRPIKDWILLPFTIDRNTGALYQDAVDAVEAIITDGVGAAMNARNGSAGSS